MRHLTQRQGPLGELLDLGADETVLPSSSAPSGKDKVYLLLMQDPTGARTIAQQNKDRIARGLSPKVTAVPSCELAAWMTNRAPGLLATEMLMEVCGDPERFPALSGLSASALFQLLKQDFLNALPAQVHEPENPQGPLSTATDIEMIGHTAAGSRKLTFFFEMNEEEGHEDFTPAEIASYLAGAGVRQNARIKVLACESGVAKPPRSLDPADLRDALAGLDGARPLSERLAAAFHRYFQHTGTVTGFASSLTSEPDQAMTLKDVRDTIDPSTGLPTVRYLEPDVGKIVFSASRPPHILAEDAPALAATLARKRLKRDQQFGAVAAGAISAPDKGTL